MSTSQSIPKEKSARGTLDYEKYPIWKHVHIVPDSSDGGGNRKWTCNYCRMVQRTSYSRVKAHLLGPKNNEISICAKVTPEIQKQLKIEVDLAELKELQKKEDDKRRENYITLPSGSDLVRPRKRKAEESSIAKAFNMKQRDELDKDCARMFYSAAIPFNLARNPYFRKYIHKISMCNVAGYYPPTYNRLRTTLLAQESTHIDTLLEPIKDGWVKRGVSICSDGWSDGSHKPIINIMAAFGSSAMFLTSVDAFGVRKDAPYIAQIFIDAIEEVGVQNIVQIVTDNGSNFKAAGQLIEVKYPSVFWTPCVVHCLNLAFENICQPGKTADNYNQCGDKYDIDADISELADLSLDDPELEMVFNDLGNEVEEEEEV